MVRQTRLHFSTECSSSVLYFALLYAVLLTCALFGAVPAQASDNERYKAIPMASGGYVFIIDTREGHAWTWNSARQGNASPSGANPRIVYQGNVRQNMKTPKSAPQAAIPSGETERF